MDSEVGLVVVQEVDSGVGLVEVGSEEEMVPEVVDSVEVALEVGLVEMVDSEVDSVEVDLEADLVEGLEVDLVVVD